jgi:ArsR family transcriptional regulator
VEAALEVTAKQFKALANKNRLAIFQHLRALERLAVSGPDAASSNVGDIAAQFDLALSTVSHHLRVLHEAELIVCEQRGQFTYCVVNQEMVERMRQFLEAGETSP